MKNSCRGNKRIVVAKSKVSLELSFSSSFTSILSGTRKNDTRKLQNMLTSSVSDGLDRKYRARGLSSRNFDRKSINTKIVEKARKNICNVFSEWAVIFSWNNASFRKLGG